MNAHTEMFEASLFLARDEATHELILLDQDAACFDERRLVAVAVDTDRQYRSVVVHRSSGQHVSQACLIDMGEASPSLVAGVDSSVPLHARAIL